MARSDRSDSSFSSFWEDYDPEEEGPEARFWRRQVEGEARWTARTEALLQAIERDGDPVSAGRRAAERLWQTYCRRVQAERGW